MLVDSGCIDTRLVVGAKTLAHYSPSIRKTCMGKELETSLTRYVFGGGSAQTIRTVEFMVVVCKGGALPIVRFTVLDIVQGWAPMLMGTTLQAELGLVPSALHEGLLLFTSVKEYLRVPNTWKDGGVVLPLALLKPSKFDRENHGLSGRSHVSPGFTVLPALNNQMVKVLDTEGPTRTALGAAKVLGSSAPDTQLLAGDAPRVTEGDSGAQVFNTGKKSRKLINKSLRRAVKRSLSPQQGAVETFDLVTPLKAREGDVLDSLEQAVPSTSKRPRCLRLSKNEMFKIHCIGHKPADICCLSMLKALTPLQRKLWSKQILKAIEEMHIVCGNCKYCGAHGHRITPQSNIHSIPVEFNVKLVIDIWHASDDPKALMMQHRMVPGVDYWHLCGVCAGSGRCFNVPFDHVPTADDVVHALYVKWISVFGPVQELVKSDNGGEFVNHAMLDLAARHGYCKEVGPALQHEAQGLVEVMNAAMRGCWKRARTAQGWRRIDLKDAEIMAATFENELNNTLQTGGYSASERSTGRSSHIINNLIADTSSTPVNPAECVSTTVANLVRYQNEAMDAYRSVVYDRQLRTFLKQQSRGKASQRYYTGDRIDYWVPRSTKNSETYRGCAVVIGFNPYTSVYYIDHGGLLIKRSALQIKFHGKRRPGLTRADYESLERHIRDEPLLVVEERGEREGGESPGLPPEIPRMADEMGESTELPPQSVIPLLGETFIEPDELNKEITDGPLGVPVRLLDEAMPDTTLSSGLTINPERGPTGLAGMDKAVVKDLYERFDLGLPSVLRSPSASRGRQRSPERRTITVKASKRAAARSESLTVEPRVLFSDEPELEGVVRNADCWVQCDTCDKERMVSPKTMVHWEGLEVGHCSDIGRRCESPDDATHHRSKYVVLDPKDWKGKRAPTEEGYEA